MKIYKYFSSDVMSLSFERAGFCGIKCSLPQDYNDPYELFLGVDLSVSTENLATYRELIQELPQYPTTCFSKSPIVPPMWAHYAKNQSGFVVEFDTEILKECFEDIEVRNVDYKDGPDPRIAEFLERAAVTMKPRHAVWLRQLVLAEAYFSKYNDWSYEQECRLVDRNQYVESVSGNDILFVPNSCLSALIIGSKFPQDLVDYSLEIARGADADWYRLQIGRSFPLPFLISEEGNGYTFEAGKITEAVGACATCSEPLPNGGDVCMWCAITDDHANEAARGNPFRALDSVGMLERYFEGVRGIEKRRRE